jgi:hypothetical protein
MKLAENHNLFVLLKIIHKLYVRIILFLMVELQKRVPYDILGVPHFFHPKNLGFYGDVLMTNDNAFVFPPKVENNERLNFDFWGNENKSIQ